MSELWRKRIVFTLAGAGLLWSAFNVNWGPSPTVLPATEAAVAVSTPSDVAATTSSNPAVTRNSADPAIRAENKPWGSDPFRRSAGVTVTSDKAPRQIKEPLNWALNGILFNSNRPFAIINGRTVSVGESIEGGIVRSITPELVVIEYQGQRMTLKVREG